MEIHDAPQMAIFTAEFLSRISQRPTATVVTLSGELGAGKTTFAQEAAKSLGVDEHVTSPTFVIEKIYDLHAQRWQKLVHIDAYRLKDSRELEALGWSKLVADPGNLILLEWPEMVAGLIPEHAIRIRFDIEGEGRKISISGSSIRQ